MLHAKKLAIASVALLAGAALGPTAFAQNSMSNGNAHDNNAMSQQEIMHMWNKMDTNRDGSISMSEHDAYVNKMFRKADANNDGKLSKQECRTAMQNKGMNMSPTQFRQWWNKSDTNHDGYISKSEDMSRMNKMFRTADTNHDGKLSKNEFRTAMENMHNNNHMASSGY